MDFKEDHAMIIGTIRNTMNRMQLVNEWENKKSSGNVLKKEKSATSMTEEERMLQHFQEQLEANRESSEYSQIYSKVASGQELTAAELDKLRQKDPKMYMEYRADRMEQEAYERRLKNCKTKEEAERLHVNTINGKLSELKSIVNNPNIPKGEKLKQAQRIMGDTLRSAETYHTFIKSTDFKELPTEEEVLEAKKLENEMEEVQSNPSDSVVQEELVQTDESDSNSQMADDVLKQDMTTELQQMTKETVVDVQQVEKSVLEEMQQIEKKYFGEQKKTFRIDVAL